MRVEQEKVRQFMEKIGDVVYDDPTTIPQNEAARRKRFIVEEAEEYETANAAGDIVEVADAIADLAYVVIGAAVSHGIDLQPIFDEVHRSNMTKSAGVSLTPKTIGGVSTEEKRCTKGPNYEKPRIAELLVIQSTGLNNESLV